MQKKVLFSAIAVVATIASVTFTSIPVQAATSAAAEKSTQITTSNYKRTKLSKSDKAMLKTMFSADYYALLNPDVVAKYGNDPDKLFEHFCNYGIFELRTPNADFNVSAYASAYGDLQKSFGNNVMSYYKHYNDYGKNENRTLTTVTACASAGIPVYSVDSFVAGQTGAVAAVAPAVTPASVAAIIGSSTPEAAVAEYQAYIRRYVDAYKAWDELRPVESNFDSYEAFRSAYNAWSDSIPKYEDYDDSYEFSKIYYAFINTHVVPDPDDYITQTSFESDLAAWYNDFNTYLENNGYNLAIDADAYNEASTAYIIANPMPETETYLVQTSYIDDCNAYYEEMPNPCENIPGLAEYMNSLPCE